MSVTTFTTVNGMILSQAKDGVVSHFVPDPLGSVVMVRDTSGNTVYKAEYDPYGNVQSETGTNPSSLGYVGTLGYIKDSATSMYVRARYLLNNLGRWLTKDPLWPSEPGYVYAEATPNMWVDPSGLLCSSTDPKPPCAQLRGVNAACIVGLCSAKTTIEIILTIISLWKGISKELIEAIKKFRKAIKKGKKIDQDECCREGLNQLKNGGSSNPGTFGGIIAMFCQSQGGKFPEWQLCFHVTKANGGDRGQCEECCQDTFNESSDSYSRCDNLCNSLS